MKFLRKPACILVLSGVAVAAAAAAATPHEQLTALAHELVDDGVRNDPMQATYLGLPGHDGELAIPGEQTRARNVARLQASARRVDEIVHRAANGLSLVDADDAKLLHAQIDSQLDFLLVRQTDRKDYAGPALAITNVLFTQFLHLPVPGRDGATADDLRHAWGELTRRMELAPAYIVAGQKLVTHPGRLFATVGARELAGAPDFFNGALSDAAKAQLAGDSAALARFAAARDALLKTLAATREHIEAHAAGWPENYAMGRAAYDHMLQREELLPFDSVDIERIGHDLLAHGWAEEAWLAALSAERRQPFGAASGGGMAPGGPALVDYYRDRIADLRRFVDQHDLLTVPAWLGDIQVIETPKFLQPVSPGASMSSPRLFDRANNGYYFITPPESLEDAAKRLDMNEDFDRDRILSTAAHEAMPGHFLQLSIARRHPDFIRKLQSTGVFAEGWAFYGEEMFVRLGLYGDDLDARLFTARWERVRGARAIVDVKLASGEWTIAQAEDFFESQSGFTKEASRAAVAGFALQPGYVVSYAVGRLQLETLLAEYMRRAGDKASLHDFHDRLLSYGTTPFSIVGPELLADLDKPASAVRAAANY